MPLYRAVTKALPIPADEAPRSQARRAYESLRAMIVVGDLAPGSMHLEAELARLLAMSRTPVHEAAILLESEGLVDIRPRRGIRVLPISAQDMEEIYEILTELEPLAAYRLALHRPGPEVLAPLWADLAVMEEAIAAKDRRRWAEADDRFHADLVRLAGNNRLTSVVSMFAAQVARARLITLQLRPLPVASNTDHRRLLDAIARGAADEARAIHRQHRLGAKGLLIGLLGDHGFKEV